MIQLWNRQTPIGGKKEQLRNGIWKLVLKNDLSLVN